MFASDLIQGLVAFEALSGCTVWIIKTNAFLETKQLFLHHSSPITCRDQSIQSCNRSHLQREIISWVPKKIQDLGENEKPQVDTFKSYLQIYSFPSTLGKKKPVSLYLVKQLSELCDPQICLSHAFTGVWSLWAFERVPFHGNNPGTHSVVAPVIIHSHEIQGWGRTAELSSVHSLHVAFLF